MRVHFDQLTQLFFPRWSELGCMRVVSFGNLAGVQLFQYNTKIALWAEHARGLGK